jgi:hypothetical protein
LVSALPVPLHVGIVGHRQRVRRAGLAGDVGAGATRIDQDRVLLFHQIGDRERDAGGWRIDDRIELVDVDPLPGNVDADVRLVLMVGGQDIDLPSLGGKAGILDRHFDRRYRIGAADIGIEARHVVQHADLDRLVLRHRWRREPYSGTCDKRGIAPRECRPH